MQCPQCRDEYESSVATCLRCGIPLATPGTKAPLRTSHLGHFVESVGDRVLQMLRTKGIDYDFARIDDGFAIRVDADWRDDIASDLYAGWNEVLAGLDRDVAYAVFALGGSHPGWSDAPSEVWADRDGRLKVAIAPDGDPDAARAIGPALMVIGLSMLLLGAVDAIATGIGVTFGLSLLVVGALLPR